MLSFILFSTDFFFLLQSSKCPEVKSLKTTVCTLTQPAHWLAVSLAVSSPTAALSLKAPQLMAITTTMCGSTGHVDTTLYLLCADGDDGDNAW